MLQLLSIVEQRKCPFNECLLHYKCLNLNVCNTVLIEADEWDGYRVVQSSPVKWTHVFSVIRLPAAEGADCALGGSKGETSVRQNQCASQSSHRLRPPFSQLQASSWSKHTPSESSLCRHTLYGVLVLSVDRVFLTPPGDTPRGSKSLELDTPFSTVLYVTNTFSQWTCLIESVSTFVNHFYYFF